MIQEVVEKFLDCGNRCVSRFHDDRIRQLFTHEVFSLMLREKLVSLFLVRKIFR